MIKSLYFRILLNKKFKLNKFAFLNFLLCLISKPLIIPLKLTTNIYSPISVYIWITKKCQKRCVFCPYKEGLESVESKESDLSIAEFVEYLDKSIVKRAIHLALYGGEPFLNPDLFKMIDYARARGHIVTVTTNGLLIKQFSSALERSPPDVLSISYYPEEERELIENLKYLPSNMIKKLNFIVSKKRLQFLSRATKIALDYRFDHLTIDNLSPRDRKHDEILLADDPVWKQHLLSLKKMVYGSSLKVKIPNASTFNRSNPGCFFMWNTLYMEKSRWSPCCEWSLQEYRGDRFEWNGPWYKDQRKGLLNGSTAHKNCVGCLYRIDTSMNI